MGKIPKYESTQEAREEQRRAEEELSRRHWAEESARRKAAAEKARKLAEEQQLAAQREADEILRRMKEVEAERRSREAGRWAREQQEQDAKERLRKVKEMEAEERSGEAAKKARQQQQKAAQDRLLQRVKEEKLESVRKNWGAMKNQADQRGLMPNDVKGPAPNTSKKVSTSAEPRRRSAPECIHPQLGWMRKNGLSDCYFCGKKCVKYSYRCPECGITACEPCKVRQCPI